MVTNQKKSRKPKLKELLSIQESCINDPEKPCTDCNIYDSSIGIFNLPDKRNKKLCKLLWPNMFGACYNYQKRENGNGNYSCTRDL